MESRRTSFNFRPPLWRRIMIRLGRDPSWLSYNGKIGPPDERQVPPATSWSKRICLDAAPSAEMPFLDWEELKPFYPQSQGPSLSWTSKGGWRAIMDAPRIMEIEQFPEFQSGDEIWIDRKNVPWKWQPEGTLLLCYGECRCRLVRDDKTIASKGLWLT